MLTSEQMAKVEIVVFPPHHGIVDFRAFSGNPSYHIRIDSLQRREVDFDLFLLLFLRFPDQAKLPISGLALGILPTV